MKSDNTKEQLSDKSEVSRRKALHLIAAAGLTAAALNVSAGCQSEGSADAGGCGQSVDDLLKTLMSDLGPYEGISVHEKIAGTGDGSVHYSVFNHIGAPGNSVYEKLDAAIKAMGGDPAVDSLWTALKRIV